MRVVHDFQLVVKEELELFSDFDRLHRFLLRLVLVVLVSGSGKACGLLVRLWVWRRRRWGLGYGTVATSIG